MSTPNTHFGVDSINKIMQSCTSVYFIGIGGINMSSLALITAERGYNVSGSDIQATAITDKLEKAKIKVNFSHDAENIHGFGAVVYTVAISEDNEEYIEAKKMKIPLISRADYMGYLMMKYKNRIGISGMHGKSTATSMCAQVFIDADTNPTVLSGAEMKLMHGAYHIGSHEHFIFEACEYMDSFLDFNPNIAVVLNVELDHVDYFKDIEQVKNSYAAFAAITGKNGYAVANADDLNVCEVMKRYQGHKVFFSLENKKADFCASSLRFLNGRADFDILKQGALFCHVSLRVPGKHNVYNALATAAVADLCGISPRNISKGLGNFDGALRRMEFKGSFSEVDFYDDYAHHPTEVKASLDSAAEMGYKRVICVFQSHTYTRTARLLRQFAVSFSGADKVIVADIYPAREKDNLGMTPEVVAKAIGKKASYAGNFESIAEALKADIRKGDMVIIMGAGNIYKVFDYFQLN